MGWGTIDPTAFRDERAVPAVLEFLEDNRVGKMPGRILLAGGPDLEEEELEGFSLQVQGGGRGGDRGELKRGRGWARLSPLDCSFLLFSFVWRIKWLFAFFFLLCQADYGEKEF